MSGLSREMAGAVGSNGWLALMLLTDARRSSRTGPDGELVPLDVQDRANWDRVKIAEGTRILERALLLKHPGPYQIQAAIAALHDEADSTEATHWRQILGLYESLLQFNDGPMVRLSRTIALAMVEGPAAGLTALDDIAVDPHSSIHYRVDAARAHLLERACQHDEAIRYYRQAAQRTTSTPERNYLLLHAARLSDSLAARQR